MKELCGCCEGTEKLTPLDIANRPGLDALSYRVGTHATFLETMMARLTTLYLNDAERKGDVKRILHYLTTRSFDDPSLALLDAWATVADVLTFYQERIANEGYLRTATERRSILELARLVGYKLRPGVSASVFLAFDLEKDYELVIEPGMRAQSLPGPGELPQSFETSEPLEAREAWNRLGVRMTRPQYIDSGNISPENIFGWDISSEDNKERLTKFLAKKFGFNWITANNITGSVDGKTITISGGEKSLSLELNDEKVSLKLDSSIIDELMAKTEDGVTGVYDRDRVINKVYLQGTATNLKPNDPLLFVFEERTPPVLPVFRKVESIEAQSVEDRTIITLQSPKDSGGAKSKGEIGRRMIVEDTTPDAASLLIEGLLLPPSLPPASPRKLERKLSDAFASKSDIGTQMLINLAPVLKNRYYAAWSSIKMPPVKDRVQVKRVEALRVMARPFGHNAPLELINFDCESRKPEYGEWNLVSKEISNVNVLHLDALYDKIVPGSWVVIERPDPDPEISRDILLIRKVIEVRTVSRADYNITGNVTRLTLDKQWIYPPDTIQPIIVPPQTVVGDKKLDVLRSTTIYAQGDLLELAEEAIESDKLVGGERVNDICTQPIELDGLYDGLKSGRWLIVSGERTDIPEATAVKASELVMLSNVTQKVSLIDEERLPLISTETGETTKEKSLPGDKVHTFLTLAKPLEYCYKRDTVAIYANVAKATHGETRSEVLGSGDGGKVFQEFQLRQSPLTYLAAPTPAGAESTLQVRVNDVLWHETDSLAGLEPVDRNYITSTDDKSRTSVVFGNGLRGSRLPSGVENVRAVYRSGIGKPGNVKAEQISQLAARPLGVKAVINPLPSSGGADRENRDQARRNVPLAVLALDRLVSVQDYADFARTFAGIGKARSTKITNGRRQVVFLTIAGAEDIPIDMNSDLYQNLVSALHKYGDPHQPIRVELRELLLLVVSANVRVLPDYLWDKVEPKIRAAMLDAFSFERRDLGQDVLLSEVISVIQAVEGVNYVDVDVLVSIPEKEFDSKIKADSEGKNGDEAFGDRRRLTPEDILKWVEKSIKECDEKSERPCPRITVNLARWISEGVFQPDQIAYLTPGVPDTLILKEVKP